MASAHSGNNHEMQQHCSHSTNTLDLGPHKQPHLPPQPLARLELQAVAARLHRHPSTQVGHSRVADCRGCGPLGAIPQVDLRARRLGKERAGLLVRRCGTGTGGGRRRRQQPVSAVDCSRLRWELCLV